MPNATEGSVASLWRYPVKSMLGEELSASEMTERGLLGDRAYALVDSADGKAATAKNPRKWPTLFGFSATFTEPPHTGASVPGPHYAAGWNHHHESAGEYQPGPLGSARSHCDTKCRRACRRWSRERRRVLARHGGTRTQRHRHRLPSSRGDVLRLCHGAPADDRHARPVTPTLSARALRNPALSSQRRGRAYLA